MAGFADMPHGTETILIVDDHDTIWDFLIEALQELGYLVLLAENGQDAVDIYKANHPGIDLVVLDMIMPVLGGAEAFAQIREFDPNAKVILSSGYASQEAVQEVLSNGACGFIAKPHRIPVIAQAIRNVLDGKPI
jgi:CheY-like chemotaxis protein